MSPPRAVYLDARRSRGGGDDDDKANAGEVRRAVPREHARAAAVAVGHAARQDVAVTAQRNGPAEPVEHRVPRDGLAALRVRRVVPLEHANLARVGAALVALGRADGQVARVRAQGNRVPGLVARHGSVDIVAAPRPRVRVAVPLVNAHLARVLHAAAVVQDRAHGHDATVLRDGDAVAGRIVRFPLDVGPASRPGRTPFPDAHVARADVVEDRADLSVFL